MALIVERLLNDRVAVARTDADDVVVIKTYDFDSGDVAAQEFLSRILLGIFMDSALHAIGVIHRGPSPICLGIVDFQGTGVVDTLERLQPGQDESILYSAALLTEVARLADFGIVHLDIKPSNILALSRLPWIRFIDIGACRAAEPSLAHKCRSGLFLRTYESTLPFCQNDDAGDMRRLSASDLVQRVQRQAAITISMLLLSEADPYEALARIHEDEAFVGPARAIQPILAGWCQAPNTHPTERADLWHAVSLMPAGHNNLTVLMPSISTPALVLLEVCQVLPLLESCGIIVNAAAYLSEAADGWLLAHAPHAKIRGRYHAPSSLCVIVLREWAAWHGETWRESGEEENFVRALERMRESLPISHGNYLDWRVCHAPAHLALLVSVSVMLEQGAGSRRDSRSFVEAAEDLLNASLQGTGVDGAMHVLASIGRFVEGCKMASIATTSAVVLNLRVVMTEPLIASAFLGEIPWLFLAGILAQAPPDRSLPNGQRDVRCLRALGVLSLSDEHRDLPEVAHLLRQHDVSSDEQYWRELLGFELLFQSDLAAARWYDEARIVRDRWTMKERADGAFE